MPGLSTAQWWLALAIALSWVLIQAVRTLYDIYAFRFNKQLTHGGVEMDRVVTVRVVTT